MQLSIVSRLKHDHFVGLKGYCLEANNRILVYEFATMGSLHDVLHGMPTFIIALFLILPFSVFVNFSFRIAIVLTLALLWYRQERCTRS